MQTQEVRVTLECDIELSKPNITRQLSRLIGIKVIKVEEEAEIYKTEVNNDSNLDSNSVPEPDSGVSVPEAENIESNQQDGENGTGKNVEEDGGNGDRTLHLGKFLKEGSGASESNQQF